MAEVHLPVCLAAIVQDYQLESVERWRAKYSQAISSIHTWGPTGSYPFFGLYHPRGLHMDRGLCVEVARMVCMHWPPTSSDYQHLGQFGKMVKGVISRDSRFGPISIP
jgi:hypothetical protein